MGLSRNRVSAALALVVLMLGLDLAAQKIEVDYDREVAFARLKTFAWDPENPLPPSFSEIDANRIDAAIRDSVERALKSKGFFQVMREADFLVSFSITGRDAQAPAASGGDPAPVNDRWKPFEAGSPQVETDREGALVLSVLDGKTRRPVWQARAGDIIEDGKKLERRIDGGIKKILKSFPPG